MCDNIDIANCVNILPYHTLIQMNFRSPSILNYQSFAAYCLQHLQHPARIHFANQFIETGSTDGDKYSLELHHTNQ